MCYVCNSVKDLRTMSAIFTLMNTIDFGKAKIAVAMIATTPEILEDAAHHVSEEGFDIQLDEVFSSEDELHRSVTATIKLLSFTEEYISEVNDYLTEGKFIVPTSEETEAADAFEGFIGGLFQHYPLEDDNEDEV